MSASAFTPTVLTISSGTGSGSGEKNYITNPSMATATTGWNVVGDFALTRSTSASELPREYTTATGIKMVATAGTQSTADYIFFDFILDDVDLNKKMKIKWSQKRLGTYAAGQLAVIITTQSDRTTALHTPITTAIPAVDTEFETTFDSGSTAALSIVIRATADMTTNDGLCLSDVIVGPGINAQGATVSEWQSFTPTGSWTANTTYTGRYRRVGDTAEVQVKAACTGAPTSTALLVNMPTGLTIDTSKLVNAAATDDVTLGIATILDGGTAIYTGRVGYQSTSAVRVFAINSSATYDAPQSVTQVLPITFGNTDSVSVEFKVPIAEWAGNGTVNLGAGAQVEYAATSGTWDADSSTTVYGPAGQALGGTLAAARTKTVTWQYPIQADDQIVVEFSRDGTTWAPANGFRFSTAFVIQGLDSAGGEVSGVYCHNTSSTQTVVTFGRYANIANDDAPAANWPSSNAFWRVRKAKASAPVGFGRATATDTGLVFRGRHQTKILAANQTSTASITGLTFNNLTIGKVYRVSGQALISQNATNLQCELRFYDGGTIIGGVQTNNTWSSGYTGSEYKVGFSFLYTATTTTMTPQWNTGATSGILNGDGTRLRTFVTVEETDLDTTTAWA